MIQMSFHAKNSHTINAVKNLLTGVLVSQNKCIRKCLVIHTNSVNRILLKAICIFCTSKMYRSKRISLPLVRNLTREEIERLTIDILFLYTTAWKISISDNHVSSIVSYYNFCQLLNIINTRFHCLLTLPTIRIDWLKRKHKAEILTYTWITSISTDLYNNYNFKHWLTKG